VARGPCPAARPSACSAGGAGARSPPACRPAQARRSTGPGPGQAAGVRRGRKAWENGGETIDESSRPLSTVGSLVAARQPFAWSGETLVAPDLADGGAEPPASIGAGVIVPDAAARPSDRVLPPDAPRSCRDLGGRAGAGRGRGGRHRSRHPPGRPGLHRGGPKGAGGGERGGAGARQLAGRQGLHRAGVCRERRRGGSDRVQHRHARPRAQLGLPGRHQGLDAALRVRRGGTPRTHGGGPVGGCRGARRRQAPPLRYGRGRALPCLPVGRRDAGVRWGPWGSPDPDGREGAGGDVGAGDPGGPGTADDRPGRCAWRRRAWWGRWSGARWRRNV
jgi:hypothetical protein